VDKPCGGHLAKQLDSWRSMELSPPAHHLRAELQSPPLLRPHLRPSCRMIWKPCSVRTPMASCRSPHLSLPLPIYGAPTTELGSILPPSFLSALPLQPPQIPLLLPLYSALHLISQTLQLLLCVFVPKPPITPTMPRLRGKSRRGVAWYTTGGKEVPNFDPPPDNDALPVLDPILAPPHTEPIQDVTQDLSPLSNPYGYRVEWF
jgi:hypothetical protein